MHYDIGDSARKTPSSRKDYNEGKPFQPGWRMVGMDRHGTAIDYGES
jgi:hypothetical protein